MTITELIKQLPNLLQNSVNQHWQSFLEKKVDLALLPDEVSQSLVKVWACSDFVMQTCVRYPDVFIELALSGDLLGAYTNKIYVHSNKAELNEKKRKPSKAFLI